MIPANELRIGNWVYTQSTKLIKEQSPTTPFRIKVVTKQEENKWHPIPLDADILGKCGFEKCTCCGGWKNSIHLDFNMNHREAVEMLYLHQLQNLYFALTGQELEIQL